MTALVRDTGIVFTRELRPVIRDPFTIIFSMIQPLFFLALFAPLLADVPNLGPGGALQWFVPGIVAMSCLFGASMTGSNLLFEMQTGSHERTLVTPLSRQSLLIGRALKEIVPVLVQTVVVIAIVTPFSFELHVPGVVVGLAIMAVFCVGLGSLSYALALAAKGQDWIFWTVQQTFLFPVLLLAGMMLPLDGAPTWLQRLSDINPLTYIIEAERGLMAGTFDAQQISTGALAAVLVCVVGIAVGTAAMRKSN